MPDTFPSMTPLDEPPCDVVPGGRPIVPVWCVCLVMACLSGALILVTRQSLHVTTAPAPHYAAPHYFLGAFLQRIGRVEEAEPQYHRALDIWPDHPDALLNTGNILARRGQLAEAAASYGRILETRPDHPDAHTNLGNVLLQQGDTVGGVRHYELAIQSDPGQMVAMSNLAWILATHPDATVRDGNRSLKLAHRANGLAGEREPVFLRTLAAAQAECGDYIAAESTARRAADLASALGNSQLAGLLLQHADHYRLGMPTRDLSLAGSGGQSK